MFLHRNLLLATLLVAAAPSALEASDVVAITDRDAALSELPSAVQSVDRNPRLSLQLLTSITRQLTANDPLSPVLRYYRGLARFHSGAWDLVVIELEPLVETKTRPTTPTIGKGWQALAWPLLIEAYYKLGESEKAVQAFTTFAKNFPVNETHERLARAAAEALSRRGPSQALFESLEQTARSFPLTESSRWAFRELQKLSCTSAGPYAPSVEFLRALSRNIVLDSGIREFILGHMEGPVTGARGRMVTLTPDERVELLIGARLFEEAKNYSERLLKELDGSPSVAPEKERARVVFDIARLHSNIGNYELSARYFAKHIEMFPLHPDSLRVRERLAESLTRLGNHLGAAQIYRDLAQRTGRPDFRWRHFWTTYRAKNYEEALRLIDLPGYVQLRERDEPSILRYWRARTLEQMNRTEQAKDVYRDILANDGGSYYSMLAVARHADLGKPPERADKVVTIPSDTISLASRIIRSPTDQRQEIHDVTQDLGIVDDLLRLGLPEAARTHLRGINWRDFDEADSFAIAGRLAWLVNDYRPSRAIAFKQDSAIRRRPSAWWELRSHQETFRDEWMLYYPLAFESAITKASAASSVDRYLLLSIMRAESRYYFDARSPVGARGLMQLMPATATLASKEAGYRKFALEDLNIPEMNIQLGTYYFSRLMRVYDPNPFLAVAAYNAGPIAVNRWLNAMGGGEVDEWVEEIPFWETRTYVKKVMRYFAEYAHVYEGRKAVTNLRKTPTERVSNDGLY